MSDLDWYVAAVTLPDGSRVNVGIDVKTRILRIRGKKFLPLETQLIRADKAQARRPPRPEPLVEDTIITSQMRQLRRDEARRRIAKGFEKSEEYQIFSEAFERGYRRASPDCDLPTKETTDRDYVDYIGEDYVLRKIRRGLHK